MTQRLGKGLSALIPDTSEHKEKVVSLKVENLSASPFQPRTKFQKDKLSELIASIKEKGVIQPLLARPSKDGKFELIAGERRLRAAKALGIGEVPVLVRDVDDVDAMELSLIENIQREELNPIEEAQAYKRLCDEFDFTQEKIGQTIGKDRSTVANLMRLLTLPKKIQDFVQNNSISMGHARAILSLEGERAQLRTCTKVVKKGLSVRQTESLVKNLTVKPHPKPQSAKDHHISSIEEELQHHFGTRVKVITGKKRGRIEIQFFSSEDLERIISLLRK